MRYPTLLAALVLAPMTYASRLQVVIFTTDRIVDEWVCPERVSAGRGDAVRSVTVDPGGFRWHAIGGVPPYHVVQSGSDNYGNVSITVMDALGELGHGYGVVREMRRRQVVECPSPSDTLQLFTAYRPIHAAGSIEKRMLTKADSDHGRDHDGAVARPRKEPTLQRDPVVRDVPERPSPSPRPSPAPTPRTTAPIAKQRGY